MKMSRPYRVLFLGGLFVVFCIGLGVMAHQWWSKPDHDLQPFYGTVLDHPRPLPAFTLEGTGGYAIDAQHLKGQWTFLFFGFTHCASICPVTMAELAKMTRLLSQYSDVSQPKVIMITLDPQRDSLQRMQAYVHAFDPKFIGARGALAEVQILAHNMGIAYTQVKSSVQARPDDYSIEHSGAIMLLNPNGDLVAFFTPPHQADLIVKDYRRLNKDGYQAIDKEV